MEQQNTLNDKFPSIKYAYEIALKSYDWVYRRSEIMDDKIEKLIAWTTGINLFIATLVGNAIREHAVINFYSIWFYCAFLCFLFGVLIGFIARFRGSLKTLAPNKLFDKKWLAQQEHEFKKNILYRAGEDFEFNGAYVNKKGVIATIMSFAFFTEAVLLAIWFIRQ